MLTPLEFRTLPCPTYPDIRLSLFPAGKVRRRIGEFAPDALHIATEGPVGIAARRFDLRNGAQRRSNSSHTFIRKCRNIAG